ncbi:tRNA uridine(34) hydroxylase-like [Polistes fuscatus]|uniref:tRNA uridine(34) hydroxylase-like n=1 Tax=Polistes fuscatus TaxID=30207 RepID=UPI001CA9C4F5|nr:tRNA uridine(34) hydroxylase-like [Polistes fuscatus]
MSNEGLRDLTWKESAAEYQPFSKMKVRLKREIVKLGVSNLDTSVRGQYVDPEHWDDFISQPDVLVIDTRNEYEVKLVGRVFSGSKDLKVAMYCTGGIRCEKSTAYMKSLGFNDVYHLKGGMLSYLEKTHNKSGNWEVKFQLRAEISSTWPGSLL